MIDIMLSDKPSEVKRRAWMKTQAGRDYIYKRTRRPGPRYTRLRHMAKKLGVEFDITREQYELFLQRVCTYCEGTLGDTGSGLDRIQAGGGYTMANAVPSCGICNRIKNNVFSFDDMKRIGALIREIRENVHSIPTSYVVKNAVKPPAQ